MIVDGFAHAHSSLLCRIAASVEVTAVQYMMSDGDFDLHKLAHC